MQEYIIKKIENGYIVSQRHINHNIPESSYGMTWSTKTYPEASLLLSDLFRDEVGTLKALSDKNKNICGELE